MINSQASVMADSELSGGQNDVDDTISILSDTEVRNENSNGPSQRRRWSFFNRGNQNNNDAPADGTRRVKALSLTCRLKGTAKVSCLITCSSIVELIGNLLALVYGIAFIQGACNFYELESNTEEKAKEYDEKLDEVLFLQRNRVGFVGLLAICLVGLIVAFLMPLGTVYKSWKSLRAEMSLLLSMCIAHLILAILYLTTTLLMVSLAVIPFRIYEIFLIFSHIRAFKKKKREEAMRAADNGDALGSATNSQNLLRNASLNNMDQSKELSSQNDKQLSSDMQLGFNFSGDKLAKQADEDNDKGKKRSKERKSSKKRKLAVSWQGQGERKNRQTSRNNDLPTENY